MELLSMKDVTPPIHIAPGDSFNITYDDGDTSHVLDTIKVKEPLIVNQVVFYKVKNSNGFKNAVVAMVGEKE